MEMGMSYSRSFAEDRSDQLAHQRDHMMEGVNPAAQARLRLCAAVTTK
jgi:hypothetical protein